ncbi:MAG TPA: glycosyltransferase family 2 protein [Ignavibacteria bacterium]|nr:glycosyltransferase family 2 protein [Ignavibacteria bacterium]HRF66634.1 glycosyltransferase family 2 protein [Ignavibacteria bacterium]HRJ04488.1 glycosyltransferase family 2 protein [Ignavibacteria bacterium]
MSIDITIINYNVSDKLKDCLESFKKVDLSSDFGIRVIDNSTLETGKFNLSEFFPDVNYFQLNSNLGFAKANNIGAKQSDSEFLCFLNPDTIVTEDFFTPIINYIKQDPLAGACAPMLLYEDNSYQTSSGFRMGFWFEFLEATSLIGLQRKIEKWKLNKLQKSFQPIKQGWLSGACMVMKRSVFEKVGGFTEDYFLNYEDIDLCKKIEDAGYNNYYFPAYKCIHLDHKSFDKNYELLVFSRYQSRLKYAKFHYNSFVAFTVRIMHIAGLFLRIILVNFLYTKLERKSRLSGYFKALKLYFGLQN